LQLSAMRLQANDVNSPLQCCVTRLSTLLLQALVLIGDSKSVDHPSWPTRLGERPTKPFSHDLSIRNHVSRSRCLDLLLLQVIVVGECGLQVKSRCLAPANRMGGVKRS
jgi:hypothetical protein